VPKVAQGTMSAEPKPREQIPTEPWTTATLGHESYGYGTITTRCRMRYGHVPQCVITCSRSLTLIWQSPTG